MIVFIGSSFHIEFSWSTPLTAMEACVNGLPVQCGLYSCYSCGVLIAGLPICQEGFDDMPFHFGCCLTENHWWPYQPLMVPSVEDVIRSGKHFARCEKMHSKSVARVSHFHRWQQIRFKKATSRLNRPSSWNKACSKIDSGSCTGFQSTVLFERSWLNNNEVRLHAEARFLGACPECMRWKLQSSDGWWTHVPEVYFSTRWYF